MGESKKINLKSVRWVEIVSRLTSDDGSTLFDVDNAMDVIQLKEKVIMEYAYIIHDKDTYDEDNEHHKKGELKPPHIHLLLKFQNNQPQKIGYIAQWFGIPENFINCKGKNWESACLYLVHINTPDKFQYAISDVSSNFDYQEFIEDYMAEQEYDVNEDDSCTSGKGKKKKKPEIDVVVEKIFSGAIREYNKTLEIKHMLLVNYSKKIELAFKVRSEYLLATQKDRHMECIYITGKSGCGKTTLARKIADSRNLAYFISSGSNDIMDGYGQEPCLIVDDIRPSVLGLSDLLKMLDPHTACSVKSRYKNKYLNCELVILTTVLSINTFYQNVFAEHDEPITQLKRRCSTYIEMDRQEILVSMWDKKTMRYSSPVVFKNTVLTEYIPKRKITPEDVCVHVADTLPFLLPDLVSLDIEGEHEPPVDPEKGRNQKASESTISELDFQAILNDNAGQTENDEKTNGEEGNHFPARTPETE